MSADNWGECPRCARGVSERHEERVARAREAYGVVPLDEFVRQQAAVNANPEPVGQTLREDYGLWVDDIGGLFHVRYKAACAACGFTHKFSHDEPTSETGAEEVD